MPVSFVASNGTGQVNGTQSVLTFNTTRQIEAGEHVVGGEAENGGLQLITSWTVGALSLGMDKQGPNVNEHHELWSARSGSVIPTATLVTVTLAAAVTNNIHAILFSLAGVAATNYVDVPNETRTGSGSSATPTTSATAVTAVADSLAVGVIRFVGTTTATPANGYTEVAEINDATANKTLQAQVKQLPATATQTSDWTLGGPQLYDSLIAVYKPEPSSTDVFFPTAARVRYSG